MARLRTRVERAAALHRQASAAAVAVQQAVEKYSPAIAPAEQYAEQRELAARLRATVAELAPGWLSASLDAVPPAFPIGDVGPAPYVRLGTAHPLDDARFPVLAPLLGVGHLAIDADARDARVAGLLRSLILRLIASAPAGSVHIRVVDAACDGETTAAFNGIPDVIPAPVTDHVGLRTVLADADAWMRAPEEDAYLVLVIASLPELTDGTDMSHIAHLARNGASRRLHLIVAGWPPPPLTAETTQPPLADSTQISLRNPHAWVGDPPAATYAGSGVGPARLNSPVYLDPDPSAELISRVRDHLAAADRPLPGERSSWTAPQQQWTGYVAAARRLDTVRRDAAKVVAEQTALAKRVRAELGTLRGQIGGQQARIGELVRDGQPVPLKPLGQEQAAADAALGRLAHAASTRRVRPPDTSENTGGIRRPAPFGPPDAASTGTVPDVSRPSYGTPGSPTPVDDAGAPSSGGPPMAPPVSGGRPHPPGAPTTGAPYPTSGPGGPVHPTSGPHGPFQGGPPTGQLRPTSGPHGPFQGGPQTGQMRPVGADPSATGQMRPVPPGQPRGTVVRPWGPPVSGVPHPAYSSSGAFPVVMVPPSAPPAPAETLAPAASPRLPEAALSMIGEARAALQRADTELADIDERMKRSPRVYNTLVYFGFAVLFGLLQVPMLTLLASRDGKLSVVASGPCGLLFAVVAFGCAWATIGFTDRRPDGQRPPRTPLTGFVISLLAATPALLAIVWAIQDAITN
ncbi:hypothetical protein Val02_86970 [Virgisporangium aliadipatigenens]|uniref:Uncharacterized protein n=1 Tax=Virgisporangium aliadipatigenens TaxID=741659 RepID=A0A8J3YUL3_9ACTN|nr:hypothetical protein [Virgisporangium aliadipatigenens]GIJ51811.1 hypothetical protein Val02_86970 [Virgisporangium aliadipatigenens]